MMKAISIIGVTLSILFGIGVGLSAEKAKESVMKSSKVELATFGAGCFWGVEQAFGKAEGVIKTQVGYMGGTIADPSYEEVKTDKTGHVEVVHVEFDPNKTSYEALLNLFWQIHDPTQLNRQGPDLGTQYRSVIFYHTPEQKDKAIRSKIEQEKSGKYDKPVVTEIAPAAPFYRAEEYHQKYLEKRGEAACPSSHK